MNKWFFGLGLLAVLQGLAAPVLAAGACSRQSPAHSVALLELYTSEGCDSCPPADRFVSALPAGGVGADQAVILSLHVDYWDYIGWKDRFASPVFTARQRELSDLAGTRTIYTPEIFVGAKELRGWQNGVGAAVRRVNAQPARADIRIALGTPGGAGLPVDIRASSALDGKLYVALVENGLVSDVRAGENRGVTLKHDFVVRQWLAPVALAGGADGKRAAQVARVLPLPPGATPDRFGISAFVQTNNGEVLQALNLPACGG